jgi:hypothetical protein
MLEIMRLRAEFRASRFRGVNSQNVRSDMGSLTRSIWPQNEFEPCRISMRPFPEVFFQDLSIQLVRGRDFPLGKGSDALAGVQPHARH